MKNRIKISYFSHAFMMLAFMGAVSACVNDDYVVEDVIKTKVSKEGLKISPTVSESSLVIANTRDGAIEDPLKERFLNTLDVFVEKATKKTVEGKDVFTGDGNIMKQYHLPLPNGGANVQEAVNNFLANSWRQEGLEVDNYYNIYVATNNPKTKADVADVAALKALIHKEDITINTESNNITGRSGNIYKKYVASGASSSAAETGEKEFMMDGVIEGWTPDKTTQDQVFKVQLKRAAAKFILNVNFAPEFLKELADDGLIVNWEGTDASGQSTKASPAWKFNNFAFGAPVFTPATSVSGVEVHNSDDNFFSKYEVETEGEGEEQVVKNISFNIITYSYPNTWDAADYATKAPSLVLSIRYYKVDGTANDYTQHYYRIPLVPQKIEVEDEEGSISQSPVTSIDRNTQYVINATIATRGSETHEDEDEITNVYYEVTSWNNEGGEDQQTGDVVAIQNYYLQVSPKVYTLHGDDDTSIDIHFSRAKNTSVGYKLFTFPDIGDPVEFSNNNHVRKTPVESGGVLGWYFSDDKRMITVSDGVTITNNNPGVAEAGKTEGTITVTSTALPNRAIKYILLRVYLKEKEGYYEDVLIRHFPTDNIQSAEGLWSSRTTRNWWDASQLTGNWWTTTNPGGRGIGRDGDALFSAKYFYVPQREAGYVRSANNTGNSTDHSWSSDTHLKNRYKYAIQISSTSDNFVIGRPVLDDYVQSKDHVVAPAFMIASQLGATQNRTPGHYDYWYNFVVSEEDIDAQAKISAAHCGSYKEVDTDGTVWTGWRLPTREEVGVILRYQNAKFDTMDPVMTGSYYWTLEGAAVATGVISSMSSSETTWARDWNVRYSDTRYDYPGFDGDQVQSTTTFIRCIRDLSATEVENLNKWKTIIDKFQAK